MGNDSNAFTTAGNATGHNRSNRVDFATARTAEGIYDDDSQRAMSDGPSQPDKPRIILPPGVSLESPAQDEEAPQGSASSQPQASSGESAMGEAGTARIAELEAQLEEKERELLRARAEMENARKRIQRSAEERVKYAAEGLVRDLLLVADDLDRALKAAEESQDLDALREGVRLVQMQFHKVMGDHGVHQVPTEGMRFDPAVHEAVGVEERPELSDQTVIAAQRHGYTLHDRVVRAAQVVVSRNAEEREAAAQRAQQQEKQPVHPTPEQAVIEPEESLERAIRAMLAEHGMRLPLQELREKLAHRPASEGSQTPLAAVEDLAPARLERLLQAMPDVSYEGGLAILTEPPLG